MTNETPAPGKYSPCYDWLCSGENVWSLTMSIGRLHPLNAKETVGLDDNLIVIIPGNPGHCQFYETFAKYLHDRSPATTSVWVLSHVGHVRIPGELSTRPEYVTEFQTDYLSQQIRHKFDFLSKYLPGRERFGKLYLIGHSIGCYMILDLFDRLLGNGYAIDRAFFLFPTLERMAETPNGKFMMRMKWYQLHHVLDKILPTLLCFLPDSCKYRLIDWRCGRHRSMAIQGTDGYEQQQQTADQAATRADRRVIEAAADLFGSRVTSQALWMGYDEMEKVRELNSDSMDRHWERVCLIYAQKDDWCPLTYRDELIKKWPLIRNVLVENKGLEHAFVIFDSRHVADLVLEQF